MFQPPWLPKGLPSAEDGGRARGLEARGLTSRLRGNRLGPSNRVGSLVTNESQPVADPLYESAVAVVLQHRRASISLVHRHLRIGYNRASQLMDQMERGGIVSAMAPNGNRDILVSPDKQPSLDDQTPYGRSFCRQMVEDTWRQFLKLAAEGERDRAAAAIGRLDERVHDISLALPEEERLKFRTTVRSEKQSLPSTSKMLRG
jgi:hypothetical protein